jgi:hypothetical protein
MMLGIVKTTFFLSLVFFCNVQQLVAKPGRQQKTQNFLIVQESARPYKMPRNPESEKRERNLR